MNILNNEPIGVLDSGVGGISVLKALYNLMPNENYIYFGDTKNAPYGEKSDEEIMKLTEKNVQTLENLGVKLVVIACNTATSIAASYLRSTKDIPIIGIEPAIKPSVNTHPKGNIIVMATKVTLEKEKFQNLAKLYSDEANIYPLSCVGLADLIENKDKKEDEINEYLKELFLPFAKTKIDAIVLGCTHYPHIINNIKNAFNYDIDFFDGLEGTSKETKRRLENEGLITKMNEKGKVDFISSLNDENTLNIMKKMFYED